MSAFRCDCKPICRFKPYAEIFIPTTKDKDGCWFYACRYHFLILRIQRLFGKRDFGWCKVDTTRERIDEMEELLWDIWSDIHEIKKEMGLEEEVDFLSWMEENKEKKDK